MRDLKNYRIGMPVIFIDSYGNRHHAIVTNMFGQFLPEDAYGKYDDAQEKLDEMLRVSAEVDPKKAIVPPVTTQEAISEPCVNLTYASPDVQRTDQYGRQLTRDVTSCVHRSNNQAERVCWIWPDEE